MLSIRALAVGLSIGSILRGIHIVLAASASTLATVMRRRRIRLILPSCGYLKKPNICLILMFSLLRVPSSYLTI
jgi:hypothetical protein